MEKTAIGIDFGGTFIKMAMVNEQGRILHQESLPTARMREEALKEIVERVKKIIDDRCNENITGIGIGLPGPIDSEKGIVKSLTNVPGWKNFKLKKFIQEKLNKPTFIDNDANLTAYGEWKFGAGRGAKNLVCITLGTGVGGGIIIDNRLYRGSSLSAGEIGHIPIFENGPQCACKGRGCLERYVGSKFIIRLAKKYIKNSKSRLADFQYITPQIISECAKKGDAVAIRIWEEIGTHIGTALTGIVNVLNPEKIVIGGGMSRAGRLIFEPVRRVVKLNAFKIAADVCKILPAKLGNNAGVIGSAGYVMLENI
jgi:glucokinase